MNIAEPKEITELYWRDDDIATELLVVWEQSVRTTHLFLENKDIELLKPDVGAAIRQVEKLYCVRNEWQQVEAFMGVEGEKLEMLFVAPQSQGKGLGKKLVTDAIRVLSVRYVDVNEQNPQALGFYEHLGFRCFDRSELDGQGNRFPILHLLR